MRSVDRCGERLQKYLARAGVASRRGCEQLIAQGRVSVNGETVRELGVRIIPDRDRVALDGEPVQLEKALHLVFNKPRYCLCTSRDDRGRQTVQDFLQGISQRIYTVGRLDYDAEGLLILTNDGDFAQRVIHPRYHVPRTYRVTVKGLLTPEALASLHSGLELDGKFVRPLSLKVLSRSKRLSRVQIEIAEGINRQVKRMFRRVGHEVTAIKRIKIGRIELGSLPSGKFRRMTSTELDSLRRIGGGGP